jgi:hypothetical protein
MTLALVSEVQPVWL